LQNGNMQRRGRDLRRPAVVGGALGLVALAFAAQAQLVAPSRLGSAREGARVFRQCRRCHSLDPGRNLAGPTLYGLFGRKAGSVRSYRYSPALRRARVVWNEDTLSLYLADPRRFAPDDRRVAGCRIADPTRLGALLAYLEQASR
jgi:cytochrome c2